VNSLLHRSVGEVLPMAACGRGSWIIDTDGREYLDACGGAAVSGLGHNHPRVLEAVERQLRAAPFIHYGYFRNEPAEALADRLIGAAPKAIAKAFFLQGGVGGQRGGPETRAAIFRRARRAGPLPLRCGRGLFLAVEFVVDRETKAPFPPQVDLANRMKDEAMRKGLMIYPMTGTADGRQGDHVIIAPAYNVTADEVDEIVKRFIAALAAVPSVAARDAKVAS
jgi:adenosylmethionine-8-amino-7-oxononanoate aminotransferase